MAASQYYTRKQVGNNWLRNKERSILQRKHGGDLESWPWFRNEYRKHQAQNQGQIAKNCKKAKIEHSRESTMCGMCKAKNETPSENAKKS